MTTTAARLWVPYCGASPTPDELLARWNFDPLLLVGMAGIFALIWRLSVDSRGRQFLCGAAALALILFVSPFCALTSALFSARVTHHVLLTAMVAPALVAALPAWRTCLPGSLAVWTGIQALTFWLWHAPGFYAAALSSDLVYWSMQITLLGTAVGFWAAVRRASSPAAIAALLAATVLMGLLGALITFAGVPLYEPHYFTTAAWNMSPLEDQQLAGLIMWAPSAALYLGAALFVMSRFLKHEEGRIAA
ncbi:cytochrome c oxidase assembly protein [Novosphingobium sp. M1R2S20]|uniref:Cytochrome c oxidase assembly protein n=1 Tax=Novosphingobium rhizovicinum TaxID=3228928 RepID=A0ABV3RE17_9SPHN